MNWSRGWKLVPRGSNSENSLFSLDKADYTCQPTISIDNQVVRFEPNPRFLGIMLNRTLTFGKNDDLISRAFQKKILGAVSHSKWG